MSEHFDAWIAEMTADGLRQLDARLDDRHHPGQGWAERGAVDARVSNQAHAMLSEALQMKVRPALASRVLAWEDARNKDVEDQEFSADLTVWFRAPDQMTAIDRLPAVLSALEGVPGIVKVDLDDTGDREDADEEDEG